MAHTFNPGAKDTEAGGSPRAPGQPSLPKTLILKNKTRQQQQQNPNQSNKKTCRNRVSQEGVPPNILLHAME